MHFILLVPPFMAMAGDGDDHIADGAM